MQYEFIAVVSLATHLVLKKIEFSSILYQLLGHMHRFWADPEIDELKTRLLVNKLKYWSICVIILIYWLRPIISSSVKCQQIITTPTWVEYCPFQPSPSKNTDNSSNFIQISRIFRLQPSKLRITNWFTKASNKLPNSLVYLKKANRLHWFLPSELKSSPAFGAKWTIS